MAEANKVARTTRTVSHAEAHEIMSRFNNSHFRGHRDRGECARYSIPADPERDDDLLMAAYIEQQAAADRRELADAEQAGYERGRREERESEFETRADGRVVPKRRWEEAFRVVASRCVLAPRETFEVVDVMHRIIAVIEDGKVQRAELLRLAAQVAVKAGEHEYARGREDFRRQLVDACPPQPGCEGTTLVMTQLQLQEMTQCTKTSKT